MIDYNIQSRKYIPLLEKWGKNLNIKNPMGVCFTKGEKGSKIHWDRKNKTYIIRLNVDNGEKDLIHELGHIWLGQIYNDMKLAHGSKHLIVNKPIIDNFVNYHLSKEFEEYYSLLLNDQREYIKGIDESFTFLEYLRTYLLSYIHYNYIFTPYDKKRYLSNIKANLNSFRSIMIQKNPKINHKWFQTLDNLLNRFRKIKDIRDSNVYYEYRDNIIKFISQLN